MKRHVLSVISYLHGSVEGIDNKKLAHLCITEGSRYTENPIKNRYEDRNIPSSEEWNKVFENIQYQYMEFFKKRLELTEHWAHIHKKNESTNKHNHVDINSYSDVSGVYYVQIPKDSGKLMLEYNINQYQTGDCSVEPVVGDFYMFPSTLNHWVTKNLGDDLRVSISFNANVFYTTPEEPGDLKFDL